MSTTNRATQGPCGAYTMKEVPLSMITAEEWISKLQECSYGQIYPQELCLQVCTAAEDMSTTNRATQGLCGAYTMKEVPLSTVTAAAWISKLQECPYGQICPWGLCLQVCTAAANMSGNNRAVQGPCGSKKCYYLRLMQQIGYQGHRIVPMAKYAHSNHACGSTQLW